MPCMGRIDPCCHPFSRKYKNFRLFSGTIIPCRFNARLSASETTFGSPPPSVTHSAKPVCLLPPAADSLKNAEMLTTLPHRFDYFFLNISLLISNGKHFLKVF